MTERAVYDALDVVGTLPEDVHLENADLFGCRFRELQLTEGSLRGAHLTDCRFEGCEMTLVDLTDATLHDVVFASCRLQAVNFAVVAADPVGLSVRFEACDLDLAVFRNLDLRLSAFDRGTAREATFVDVDLRGVLIHGLDLSRAEIRGCDLRDADLRGSTGFVLSPCDNRVRGLRIDLGDAVGLLAGAGVRWA